MSNDFYLPYLFHIFDLVPHLLNCHCEFFGGLHNALHSKYSIRNLNPFEIMYSFYFEISTQGLFWIGTPWLLFSTELAISIVSTQEKTFLRKNCNAFSLFSRFSVLWGDRNPSVLFGYEKKKNKIFSRRFHCVFMSKANCSLTVYYLWSSGTRVTQMDSRINTDKNI